MSKIAALYARVSTLHQEQEATIDSQIASIEAYGQAQGYELLAEHYFVDQGVSGAKLARPALDRLRDLAAEGQFELVLCLSPDRLARQYAHQWVLMDELQRAGVRVVFVNQPDVSRDPQGQLFLGIQGLFAEYERAMITERLRRGKLYRMRQGQLVNSNAPYGYRYIPISEPDGGRWEADPVEAEVVRQIFERYIQAEPITITQLVDWLQEQGQSSPRRGTRWTYSTVQAILKRPAYTGRAYYNRTFTCHEVVGRPRQRGRGYVQTPVHRPRPREEWIELSVPRLVSQTIWEQAQERLAMNQKFATRNQKTHFYLLKGLLVCATCGRTLIGRTSNNQVAYFCPSPGKHRRPDVPRHSCYVAGQVVEPLVWQAVSELLQTPALLADAWQSEQQPTATNDEVTRLQARQRALQRQWSRLLDAFQEGLLDKAELRQRKARFEAQQQSLAQRLRELTRQQRQQQAKAKMLADFDTYCQKIQQTLVDPSPQLKQEVIRLLVDHIVVEKEAIIIKHIIPTDDDCRLLPGRRITARGLSGKSRHCHASGRQQS